MQCHNDKWNDVSTRPAQFLQLVEPRVVTELEYRELIGHNSEKNFLNLCWCLCSGGEVWTLRKTWDIQSTHACLDLMGKRGLISRASLSQPGNTIFVLSNQHEPGPLLAPGNIVRRRDPGPSSQELTFQQGRCDYEKIRKGKLMAEIFFTN